MAIVCAAIIQVEIIQGGNCPSWQLSRVAIVWVKIVWVAIVPGGNCPGGNCLWWQLSQVAIVSGGNCLGSNCPRWRLSRVEIVQVAIVRVAIVPGGNCLNGNCPSGGNCPRTVHSPCGGQPPSCAGGGGMAGRRVVGYDGSQRYFTRPFESPLTSGPEPGPI
jgi:hypothetical protein